MIGLTVNGEPREVASGTTISELLGALGLHPGLVVVEHNREILGRDVLDEVVVREGDNVELVHFVGGG